MTKSIRIRRDRCLVTNGRRHIPLPTGPFQNVGIRDIMIGFSKLSGIMVRLYYPAADQSRDIKSQYLMWPNWLPHENYREGYMSVAGIRWSPLQKAFRWYTGDVFLPALPKAKPLTDRKMPLIVFSHGVGACRTTYSALCLDLASHGFMVAAVEHRDGSACCTFYAKETRMPMSSSNMNISAPDGPLKFDDEEEAYDEIDDPNYVPPKALSNSAIIPHITTDWIHHLPIKEGRYNLRNKQIHRRVKECIRTLDLLEALEAGYEVQNLLDPLLDPTEFEGLIDIDKAVIMGHSVGGATTLMSLSTELRFKAGVCLDAWMYPIYKENFDLVTQPVLFINTQAFQTKENLRAIKQLLNVSDFDRPYELSSPTGEANKEDNSSRGSRHEEAPGIERKVVTIKDTVHFNQTDIPFVMPWLVRAMLGANSSRNFFTAHDLTSALSLDFMHKHLKMSSLNIEKEVFLSLQKKKLKSGIKDKI